MAQQTFQLVSISNFVEENKHNQWTISTSPKRVRKLNQVARFEPLLDLKTNFPLIDLIHLK
jgi:hypothetical protein